MANPELVSNLTNLESVQNDLTNFWRLLQDDFNLSKSEIEEKHRDITDATELKKRLVQATFIRQTLKNFASEKENVELALKALNDGPCLLIEEKYQKNLISVIPSAVTLIDGTDKYKSGLVAVQEVEKNIRSIKTGKKLLSLDIAQLKIESKKLVDKRKELNFLND